MPALNYLEDEQDYLPPLDDDEEESRGTFRHPVRPGFSSTAFTGPGDLNGDFLEPETGDYLHDAAPDLPEIGPIEPKTGGTPASTRQNLDPSGLTGAMERERQIRSEQPERPKPKWWQNLIAGAAGKGEYIGPDYRRKMADWQRRMGIAQADTSAEAKKLSALEQIQRVNSEADLRDVQMQTARARLAAAQHTRPKDDLQVVGDGLYNATTHTWVREPSPKVNDKRDLVVQDGLWDTVERKWVREPSKQPTEPKPIISHPGSEILDPNDPTKVLHRTPTAGPKPASPKDFNAVSDDKDNELRRLKIAAQAAIERGQDANDVYGQLRDEYQAIQNNYESRIRTLGGDVTHFEYPAHAEFIAQQTGRKPAPPKPEGGATGGAQQATLPPQAAKQLKRGVRTKFANGQVWTLGADGKPKQVTE